IVTRLRTLPELFGRAGDAILEQTPARRVCRDDVRNAVNGATFEELLSDPGDEAAGAALRPEIRLRGMTDIGGLEPADCPILMGRVGELAVGNGIFVEGSR